MAGRDAESAVYGLFDGLTTGVGVSAALSLSGRSSGSVVVAVLAAAAAAAIGMGAGKWLSDSDDGLRESAVMAAATAGGGCVPAVPFLAVGPHVALGAALLLAAGVASWIGRLRGRGRRGYLETYGVLAVVAAVTVSVGVLAGAT